MAQETPPHRIVIAAVAVVLIIWFSYEQYESQKPDTDSLVEEDSGPYKLGAIIYLQSPAVLRSASDEKSGALIALRAGHQLL